MKPFVNGYKYAFGDEAGDLGFAFEAGSSNYFVMTLVFLNEIDVMQSYLVKLRRDLGQSENAEFKFYKTSNNYRRKFLNILNGFPFKAYALVVNKSAVADDWANQKDSELYAFCLAYLVGLIPQTVFDKTFLVLDQFGKPNITKRFVDKRLKEQKSELFKQIRLKRSKGNDGLQCADIIVGSIMRSWDKQDKQFWNLIQNKTIVWQFP